MTTDPYHDEGLLPNRAGEQVRRERRSRRKMAEHMEQPAPPQPHSGFDRMGSPIPYEARQAAYEAAKEMGLDKGMAYECVDAMSEQLQRDKPYEARHAGMGYVDLTGTYRLMAVLLATPESEDQHDQ